jgi:hypothetical protein
MEPTDKPFVCSCQEELRTRDDVDRHDRKWFELGHTKRCQFKDCDKVSPQTYNAKRHWKTHLPAELGRYFCQKCSTSYAKKHDLKKHEAADTCRYNRRRCPAVNEEGVARSVPPVALQNDRSIDVERALELQPMPPEALSNDPSLTSAFAANASPTEASYPNPILNHLGYFPYLDNPNGPWSDFTAADLNALFDAVSTDWQQPPPLQPGPYGFDPFESSIRDYDVFDLEYYERHNIRAGLPSSPSLIGCGRNKLLPIAPKQRPQRARLAVQIEKMITKIVWRGDKSRIKSASTTNSEDKVACLSLPFRLRRSAAPSTKQSIA